MTSIYKKFSALYPSPTYVALRNRNKATRLEVEKEANSNVTSEQRSKKNVDLKENTKNEKQIPKKVGFNVANSDKKEKSKSSSNDSSDLSKNESNESSESSVSKSSQSGVTTAIESSGSKSSQSTVTNSTKSKIVIT